MNILLVKLSSLGDVVHALPVVQDIHAALPGAQIDWVVEKSFAAIVALHPGVRRVIACEIRRWRKSPLSAVTRQQWNAFKADLRQLDYDAVIDLQGLTKSALVARLARLAPGGKRYALGNQTDGSGYEAPTRWVADVAICIKPHIHAVQRSRELAARALGYSFAPSPDYGLKRHAAQAGRTLLAPERIANRVAFVHGTSRADKEWPLAHWTALGHRLNAAGYQVALPHGNEKEKLKSQAIAKALNQSASGHAIALPLLPLDALTHELAQCAGVIGVDSGISHIAVALDLPHVQLYNFDTAWRTGPDAASGRQVSVYAAPAPGVDDVWRAWLGCLETVQGAQERPSEVLEGSAYGAGGARALYSVLMTLGQPLLRRKLARRGQQEPGYLEAVDERFGHYRQPPEAASELVWVHAVSLGETRTAAVLLKTLRAHHPALRLLLTHGTATGREEGRALLQSIGRPGDVQVWQPWDSPAAVKRFFSHFRPRLGLLMETEIWPNLVAQARARGMPLVLVNGRLSAKSLKQAQGLAALALPAYGALSAVYAQTQADAERFRQLGAPVAGVFGNLKFDATPDAAQLEKGRMWRETLAQPVLMFASSREGEEDDFLKQISAIAQATRAQAAMNLVASQSGKAFKALIVPRHPQRFDEVAALVVQHGLRVSRRSQWSDSPMDSEEAMSADVWLGDSLGEMALYYGLSKVALLGGSFAPLGGQNLIEAAACGCPVVMGPHTFNFTEAAQLAEAEGAAQRAADMAQAVQAGLGLMNDQAALAKAVNAGLAFAAQNQGAMARTEKALRVYL